MFFLEKKIEFNELNDASFEEKNISVVIARLDKIHPVVSGNKLFKLYYFLEEAGQTTHKRILTFGGAYSNHLAAAAYACAITGIHSVGIIRGERPAVLSHTLKQCEAFGMELHFISREDYLNKDDDIFIRQLKNKFGECIIIPEGGYHPLGAKGASLIMNELITQKATHVCTPIGTATTVAGLLLSRPGNEKIIGIPVLKNMTDIKKRISFLIKKDPLDHLEIFNEYHFGGYAKKTTALIAFMNDLYDNYKIPTDFVYTAKMMYAIIDKIKTGHIEEGSKIICLHTGGLQGNNSLEPGTLNF